MKSTTENSIHDFLQNQITVVPLSLNNNLSNFGIKFNHRDDFDEITTFIDEFIDGNNVNRFIVLPGLRGVGKTTILFQVYHNISKNTPTSLRLGMNWCDKIGSPSLNISENIYNG